MDKDNITLSKQLLEREFQYSSGFIKPEAFAWGIARDILDVICQSGLSVVFAKRLVLTQKDVSIFYHSLREATFYEKYSDHLKSGSSLFYIVKGERAIEKLNDLVGYNEPDKAKSYTIRHMFGRNIRLNTIHSTETTKTFFDEVSQTTPEFLDILKWTNFNQWLLVKINR